MSSIVLRQLEHLQQFHYLKIRVKILITHQFQSLVYFSASKENKDPGAKHQSGKMVTNVVVKPQTKTQPLKTNNSGGASVLQRPNNGPAPRNPGPRNSNNVRNGYEQNCGHGMPPRFGGPPPVRYRHPGQGHTGFGPRPDGFGRRPFGPPRFNGFGIQPNGFGPRPNRANVPRHGGPPNPLDVEECHYWRNKGCNRGIKCRYAHIPAHKNIEVYY